MEKNSIGDILDHSRRLEADSAKWRKRRKLLTWFQMACGLIIVAVLAYGLDTAKADPTGKVSTLIRHYDDYQHFEADGNRLISQGWVIQHLTNIGAPGDHNSRDLVTVYTKTYK